MIINAKFDSRCTTCGQQIKVGNRVQWEKGVKGVRCVGHVGHTPRPAVVTPYDELPPEEAEFATVGVLATADECPPDDGFGGEDVPF